MITCSQEAAYRYKVVLDRLLQAKIAELETLNPNNYDLEVLKRMQIACIISAQGNDKPYLKEFGNEHTHDKQIASFKLGYYAEDTDKKGNKITGEVGIIVVADMLLTGFDAPIEQVMYLDDIIRDHNLLQAIARVNRTSKGKECGYVVDYVGVFNHLKKALKYFPHEEHFRLLEEHERVQIKRNLGREFSVDKAYSFYKVLYPNGVNQETFEKSFLTISGYTVDEKGKTKNLTNIVKDFISKFVDPKAEVSFDRSMLLDYVESQMLSHANGYMWYANRGAWGDVNNVIIGMDMCLVYILESILTMFNAHKAIEETNYYKPIINLVRNSVKRVKVLCDEKIKILGVPGIAI